MFIRTKIILNDNKQGHNILYHHKRIKIYNTGVIGIKNQSFIST